MGGSPATLSSCGKRGGALHRCWLLVGSRGKVRVVLLAPLDRDIVQLADPREPQSFGRWDKVAVQLTKEEPNQDWRSRRCLPESRTSRTNVDHARQVGAGCLPTIMTELEGR